MNKYVLIRTGFEPLTTSCDRCGHTIKWTYTVKDLVTGGEKTVGCDCIDKVLYLENESIKKAIEKEIAKYSETLEEYKNYMKVNIEDLYKEELSKDWYNKYYRRNRNELYYSVVQGRVWKIESIIKITKDINNGHLKNYIKLENLEELKQIKNEYEILMQNIKDNNLYINDKEKEINEIEVTERKAKKEEEKRQQEELIKEVYIGLEDEKVVLKEVELIAIESDEGHYGITYWYTFKKDNYSLVWKTTKDLQLKVNSVINIKGTIKENRKCKEGNFSYLTRCKIS